MSNWKNVFKSVDSKLTGLPVCFAAANFAIINSAKFCHSKKSLSQNVVDVKRSQFIVFSVHYKFINVKYLSKSSTDKIIQTGKAWKFVIPDTKSEEARPTRSGQTKDETSSKDIIYNTGESYIICHT